MFEQKDVKMQYFLLYLGEKIHSGLQSMSEQDEISRLHEEILLVYDVHL